MEPICIAHRAHQKKMPGSSGCFDIRKQFCVQLWSANTAPWMHPRQSRVASFLDWDHKALPIEDTTKAPSPDEAFYFQISINALFPAAGEPLLFFSRRRFALLSSFHCGQSCCLPLRACQDPAVCFCLKIYLFDQWHSLYLPDIEEPICVPIINR